MTAVWDKMRDSAERARECFAQLGDTHGTMRAHIPHREALTRLLQTDESLVELTQAWEFFKSAGEARCANYALSALSRNALWRGDVQLARDRAEQVLAEARSQGDERLVGVMLNNLAEREFAIGNVDRAIEVCRESIARDRKRKDAVSLGNGLANLAATRSKSESSTARSVFRTRVRTCVLAGGCGPGASPATMKAKPSCRDRS
jgi:tetratricopeptide (TPR) repeat protein